MACTITDKEKEVLANAGFKPSPFGDWDSPNFQWRLWPSDAGFWYAYKDASNSRGYVAKSRSVSALLVHCQLTEWQPVCSDYRAAPLVGG